jgi:hypothetical protein
MRGGPAGSRLLVVPASSVADLCKTRPRVARWSRRPGNGPDLVLGGTSLVVCCRRTPQLRGHLQADVLARSVYDEVGRCGERSTSRVISLGAKTRNGGPQKPVPRLV